MGVILALLITAGTPTDWDVARAAVSEMFDGITGLERVNEVLLFDTKYSSNDAGYLVRSELSNALAKKGIEVYLSSSIGSEPEYELRYLVNEIRVVHKRSYRKLLVGERMIERWVQADVEITLVKNNKVISQQRLTTEKKSEFPESELDLVRSSITKEHYTSSSAGSLWEPLLVTAMVGTLIYIFYAPKD